MGTLTVVPAIDLRHGRVVRLREGKPENETQYADDPAAVAREFAAQGAVRLHVVDLDGAIDALPQTDVVASLIAAAGIPVEVGGGIRSVEAARRYADLGAQRVIFGTAALRTPEVVQEAVRELGAAVAVALDARDGRVTVRGWQEISDTPATELARAIVGWGVGRIQYTDVSRDGTLVGPNLNATAEIARVSGVPVTAAGGISALADIEAVAALLPDGVDEVIVGKALYERRFTLSEATAVARGALHAG